MRMRTMRHPKLDGRRVDVPEQSVPHHQRGGWELVDDTPTSKPHPANTPATDPAVVREPVGAEAPAADDAGDSKSTTARRARTEGSA